MASRAVFALDAVESFDDSGRRRDLSNALNGAPVIREQQLRGLAHSVVQQARVAKLGVQLDL